MQKTSYKQFVIMLLLITFVGQALASVRLCCESQAFGDNQSSQFEQQILGANSSMIMPGEIDHDSHQKSKPFVNPQTVLDTADAASQCNTDCECSMGGCTPAVLSASQAEFDLNFGDSAKAYKSLPQDRLITALYRPPISR